MGHQASARNYNDDIENHYDDDNDDHDDYDDDDDDDDNHFQKHDNSYNDYDNYDYHPSPTSKRSHPTFSRPHHPTRSNRSSGRSSSNSSHISSTQGRQGKVPTHLHTKRGIQHRHPRIKSQHDHTAEDPLTKVKNLTQKSISLATSATMSTLKTGGKAAYYLTAPKYVSKKEICGIWRLDQTVGSAACAANIEFTPRGDAITKYKGEEKVTGYLFQSRNWPMSCTIEFEADAFQGPGDEVPVRYYYKGSFRRKIADKNVIKIVGTIYEVKKGRFGRGNTRGMEIGSFVARRRIAVTKDRNRHMSQRSLEGQEEDDRDDFEEGVYDEEYDSDGYDSDGYDV